MRKGHLPGRPVQLNEFSRGYLFTDLTYVNAPELGTEGTTGALTPCVLVASSLGLLLRVDCTQEQVVCAYQLHSGPIRSLCVNGSYAVTGGDDARMRIWPLHFTDFLMEAHHEAAVTHVFVSPDMRLLSVGTASGTLGILDVMDHRCAYILCCVCVFVCCHILMLDAHGRYWTVLRSHVGSVVSVATRPPLGEEFLSVGKDNTIRLWDATTGQQKFEFDSPQDTPLCGAYHPVEHVLAVGFSSGAVRIFDVQTTSTRFERLQRNPTPIATLAYSQTADFTVASQVRLYALSLSGQLSVYDVGDNYTPIRSISLPSNPWEGIIARDIQSMRYPAMIQMSISKDGRHLATSCGSINSLCVFDTEEMVTVYKGSNMQGKATHGVPAGANTDQSALSFQNTMASSLRSHGSHGTSAASGEAAPVLGKASTPIAGLVFCLETDRVNISDTNTLLIVTDSRVISLDIAVRGPQMPCAPAVLESQYASILCQDDISCRRIEGNVHPVAGSVSRDHSTGLLFMAVRCEGAHGNDAGANVVDSTTPYSKYIRPVKGDALAVVGCTVKRTRDPQTYHPCCRLSLTGMQLYTDIPGDKCILSTAPCGPSSNRIIMADSSGGVAVYYMRDDRIAKLKERTSPQQSPTPLDDSLVEDTPFDAQPVDIRPPSPPSSRLTTAQGIDSDEDRMERDLGADFAELEVTSQHQSGQKDQQDTYTSSPSPASAMHALYDSTESSPDVVKNTKSSSSQAVGAKDTLKNVVAAWEEESGGPIGTPPYAASKAPGSGSSVHWKEADVASSSEASRRTRHEQKLVSSSKTTSTTTTTTSHYTKSIAMTQETTRKRTTKAVTLAAARSTASSRSQKSTKKDPQAMIRRSGSSLDESTSPASLKAAQTSIPISPVEAQANRSHDLNTSLGSDTELVKEQMERAHFSSHDLLEGYESDGDSVDSDKDTLAVKNLRSVVRNGSAAGECAFLGPMAPSRVLSQSIKGAQVVLTLPSLII